MTIPNSSEKTSCSDNHALLVGASCVAIATLVPVALYQVGVVPRLCDPPLRVFDSERITMSKAAHPFGVPDALLGLASFGSTLTLALMSKRSRMANKLLGAKLVLDASAAAFNAGRQVVSFGRLCSWCTGTALSAGVMAYVGRASIRNSLREAATVSKAVGVALEKGLRHERSAS
jgi:uncharacterized membrane protein